MKNLFRYFILSTVLFSVSGCLQEPGHVMLVASNTDPVIDETVTFTITGIEEHTCIEWSLQNGNAYTVISGGGQNDLTMTAKFTTAGISSPQVVVKNCKDGCSGKCVESMAAVVIDVQE